MVAISSSIKKIIINETSNTNDTSCTYTDESHTVSRQRDTEIITDSSTHLVTII